MRQQGKEVALVGDVAQHRAGEVRADGRVLHIDDRIAVAGSGARAEILGIGTVREFRESDYFVNASAPPARVLMTMARQRTRMQGALSPGTRKLADAGTVEPSDYAFIRRLLTQTRETVRPSPMSALAAGVSDVRMFRVWAGGGQNNITLTGSPRVSPP